MAQNAALEALNDRLKQKRFEIDNENAFIERIQNAIHDAKIKINIKALEIGQLESAIAAVKRNITDV